MSKTSTTHLHDLVDRYLAAWNEADDARRGDLVARTFAPGARYVDPMVQGEGHAAIAAMIRGVQTQYPGLTFVRTGTPDQHGRNVRFSWHLGPAGAAPLAGGTDFAVLDADGRLATVTGFLDFVPPGLAAAPA
jgi:hypothetical protein